MKTPFAPTVGGVLSADVAVPEHAREIEFYSQVLTTGSAPLWQDDLMNNRDQPVIGLGERTAEYDSLPLQWMPHFQVADIADSVRQAVELGGREIMHGKDDDGQSQWAVVADPEGAAFGLIPVVNAAPIPADQLADIGRIAWLTLEVTELSTMCKFYQQVIGWKASSDDDDSIYEMQRPDGVPAAHINAADDTNGIPTVWILHLPVDDFDASLRRVEQYDGKIVRKSDDATFAIIRDPVGVYIGLQSR